MVELVPIVALIMIFGPSFYWLKRRFDFKEKQLNAGDPGTVELLQAAEEERKLLVERIENLEAIVCNNDYELNMRIAQLSAGEPRALGPGTPEAEPETEAGPNAGAEPRGKPAAAGALARAADDDATGLTLAAGRPDSDMDEKAAVMRAAAVAPAAIAVGKVLAGRYRIERLLGRGGMGAVYLAKDQVLGEHVALKVIAPAWHHDHEALVERFRREASAARKVSSPNVIRIHDIGEAPGGLLYLSMEYFDGKTLAELVVGRGPLGKRDLRDIVGQVCDGLDTAHRAGVVHRDLKPQNVLVGERNTVKLIDFGLAKTTFAGAGLTATGLLLGTPHYMAPEQVRGKDVDARTDIYALGALAYYAATGRPPFEGDNPIAISFAHLSETPVRPRALNPAISVELDEIIMDALAKDPRDRPQSAAVFRQAL
jgi:eukaryotic-like serine/threonine-protein kinase